MQAIPETGIGLYTSQISAGREVAEGLLESADKVEKLVLDSARQNLDSAFGYAEALAAARDPQGMATLQHTFFGKQPQALLESQKQLMQIALDLTATFGHATETVLQAMKAGASAVPAEGQAGVNGANALMGGWLPMWDTAIKEFSKSANRVMHAADLNGKTRPATPAKSRAGARA